MKKAALWGEGGVLFTGLIQDVGRIRKVERVGGMIRLTLQTHLSLEDFVLGESIAVDGVCLTVVELGDDSFQVEVSPETLERTTLKMGRPGALVNLERALRPFDRLGGHILTGHIDAVGTIGKREEGLRYLRLEVAVPKAVGRYMVEKGSVAVDGVSLTVNRCGEDWFDLLIIPHTLARTTLGGKGVGGKVNVECDILAKYVARCLEISPSGPPKTQEEGGVTEALLRKHGFL